MGILLHILFPLVVFGFTLAIDADAKPLFLCDDAKTVLLTDRAELGCPLYRPQAELIIVPDGTTWADVEWAVALKLTEPTPPQSGAPPAERASRCQEWGDLNLPTDGELDMEMGETTPQLLELSRIVTPTNLCEEYLDKQVYPRF